jgi:hypothetical protein
VSDIIVYHFLTERNFRFGANTNLLPVSRILETEIEAPPYCKLSFFFHSVNRISTVLFVLCDKKPVVCVCKFVVFCVVYLGSYMCVKYRSGLKFVQ